MHTTGSIFLPVAAGAVVRGSLICFQGKLYKIQELMTDRKHNGLTSRSITSFKAMKIFFLKDLDSNRELILEVYCSVTECIFSNLYL